MAAIIVSSQSQAGLSGSAAAWRATRSAASSRPFAYSMAVTHTSDAPRDQGSRTRLAARTARTAIAANATLDRPIAVSVNVSTRQFIRHDFVATVERALAATGCRPDWLKLEITESLLLEDDEAIAPMLDWLQGLQCGVDLMGPVNYRPYPQRPPMPAHY